MNYYLAGTMGDLESDRREDYCFTDTSPKGNLSTYALKTGTRCLGRHEDANEVSINLGEDYPGLKLPSFIGNADSLLIVSRTVADIIRARDVGDVEVVPFKLINHKGRVHSLDFVLFNPLGVLDCLDLARSECVLRRDGSVLRFTTLVLSAATKLRGVRHLFRIKEAPHEYVVSEVLVDDLRQAAATNFSFSELEQTA